jgi:hypothetical protein
MVMRLPSLALALALPLCGLWAQTPGTALEQGQQALRANRPEAAHPLLEAWLKAHPEDDDARTTLGFAALRLGRVAEASALFQRVRAGHPRSVDAAYGAGLCLLRLDRPQEARQALEAALALDPARADVREALAQAKILAPDPLPSLPALARPAALQLPARVQGQRFEVGDGQGGWRPFFIKGMNLGAALPGRHPSEFPDKATYAGWISEMAELGVNTVRVYTVHPPGFYEALAEHNARAAKPLWLIHGVWAEPPPGDDFLDEGWWAAWRAEMRAVADLLHGHANLPPRPGHASGAYRADVSPWTLAIILGREWEPPSILGHNKKHPGLGGFQGRFVTLKGGHGAERFMAQAMEAFLAYEFDTYHAQRPLAFTNWPTLDPLTHPTEATKKQELAWHRKYGLPASKELIREFDNDGIGLDLEKMEALPACPAGLFASYHAYPYYPDFMNLDPGYQKGRDREGPNHYAAYLRELVAHHRRHPTLIAEFGVPSSRLVAHWQPQGLTHGGQNEREQGEQDARLFRAIHETGCAGGLLFAWIDEWFKKNWLVLEFEEPLERKPLWYNAQDAEENYGLIAYRPGASGPVIQIDGRAADWQAVPDYLAGPDLKLKAVADEGWLHLGVFYRGTQPDWAKEGFLVGLDTHDPALGNHRLPWGLGLRSEAGLEGVVRFQGPTTAFYLDEPYDLFTHRYARPYRSISHSSGRFLMPRTESNRPRIARDGTRFPAHRQEIGWLRRGTQDRSDPAYDSRTEWREGDPGGGWSFLEASLPWGLLNVSDPSSRRVVRDALAPEGEVGTAITEGFRLSLVRFHTGAKNLKPSASLPAAVKDTLPMPPLFTWPTWERPTFHRVRKQGFDLVRDCLRTLPD